MDTSDQENKKNPAKGEVVSPQAPPGFRLLSYDELLALDVRGGSYTLPGPPIPLARPRHGNGRTWTPQKAHLNHAGIDLASQHNNQPLFSGPLHLYVTFYMSISKSLSQKKRALLDSTLHSTRPDLSNLIKFVEDAANNILYKDDSEIAKITAYKLYSTEPRTEFTLSEFSHDD